MSTFSQKNWDEQIRFNKLTVEQQKAELKIKLEDELLDLIGRAGVYGFEIRELFIGQDNIELLGANCLRGPCNDVILKP